jgi:hypothetical protein
MGFVPKYEPLLGSNTMKPNELILDVSPSNSPHTGRDKRIDKSINGKHDAS